MLKKSFVFILLTMHCCLSAAELYTLDSCATASTWKLILGREFPGAQGKLNSQDNSLKVDYNFEKGGKYIAIQPQKKLPDSTEALIYHLKAGQKTRINYRIVDATGRYFQGKNIYLEKDVEKGIEIKVNGPWQSAWGGKKSKNPVAPYNATYLLVSTGAGIPDKGSLLVRKVEVALNKAAEPEFTGKNGRLIVGDWDITAEWQPQLTGALLKVSAKTSANNSADISITFPQMVRAAVFNKSVAETTEFFYKPPFTKGNLQNIYKIKLAVKSVGITGETIIPLTGAKAEPMLMGKPQASTELKPSKFGVCTHFAFGQYPAYKYWADYKNLIDGISECGYKWIRDEVRPEKQKDGSYKINDYNMSWLKYAKSKDIDIIGVIRLYPDKSIDQYKEYVKCIVESTNGLVNVFELGNEPNNFGWKPKYGGNWNGFNVKDGTIDKWVKEHLKYTNALADYIKEIKPDATVLALGSSAPTNLHAIKLGLSKSVDGVVEHPYTFSMPPEKVPFSKGHLKRDGILVSKSGSFEEMIETYDKVTTAAGKQRPVWITEFGFTTFCFDGKNEKGLYAGFSEEAQATYLVRRFIHGLALAPVAVACQYDFIDDHKSTPNEAEANFGIIRTDYSKKPSYYAIQRMNSLFNGYTPNFALKVEVTKEPLHRSCVRGIIVKNWDDESLSAVNKVKVFAFKDDKGNNMLAAWSAQPYSGEFNNRICTIKVAQPAEPFTNALAIDIITGVSYDIPFKTTGTELVFENFSLKQHPVVIKLLK